MSDEYATPDYEVRLVCENGDIVAHAEVRYALNGWEVDIYSNHYLTTQFLLSSDGAERSARQWIKEQTEYGTDGYSVQRIRGGNDVSADPCESF